MRNWIAFAGVICVFAGQPDPASDARPVRWSVYATATSVRELAGSAPALERAAKALRELDVSKVYVEVYRGRPVDRAAIERVRDGLRGAGFEVAGGIATVPGEGWGVRQDASLDWFNWQNEKTQRAVETVARLAAELFDEIIVDDFVCTADTSLESDAARGGRGWDEYRRDLLVELSERILVRPAREVNPNVRVIIKFPQWYDRFHKFGYDLARQPGLFDAVWVGTETRGATTQRYGFVQPYEGFVNYRWIESIAGGKTGGAWFDHLDCDGDDYLEQCYETVLAGAPEIILFHLGDTVAGLAGHARLKEHQKRLAELSLAARAAPRQGLGVAAYKPPNSEAGGEEYLMDFMGMLGVPIVPQAQFPDEADVLFLPAQGAADAELVAKVERAIQRGATIVVTTGAIAAARDGERLGEWAAIRYPIEVKPVRAESVVVGGETILVERGLDVAGVIETTGAQVLIGAVVQGAEVPFLTRAKTGEATVHVLNARTFTQNDYDAVGEFLLCPRRLGIAELPRQAANELRDAFTERLGWRMEAGPGVAAHPMGERGMVVVNFRFAEETVRLQAPVWHGGTLLDAWSGRIYHAGEGGVDIALPARSRVWLRDGERWVPGVDQMDRVGRTD
jgi:hypothetical protein